MFTVSQGEVDSSLSFDRVLLIDNDGQVKVGAPVVEGASVKCKILKHVKDDKVLVFKKNVERAIRSATVTVSICRRFSLRKLLRNP